MFSIIAGLIGELFGGVKDHFADKRALKKAIVDNKIRLAQNAQSHNQEWEMKQLDNAGWKDDILFYFFIAVFIWAGIDPSGASLFFANLAVLPEWFIKIWFWVVASVLGVKKIGDYVPGVLNAMKDVFTKKK
jgi:hypothetical protein